MNKKQRHCGFSLTEVLIAVGILSVGMIFVAGVFPAGIYFTTVATERTVAAVVADEAFAKIKLYDIAPNKLSESELRNFNDVLPATISIEPNEFTYPSANISAEKQYFWSALCRRAGSDPNRLVQVTVFISRKVSPNLEYLDSGGGRIDRPVPVNINVDEVPGPGHDNELKIRDSNRKTFINDGYTIVDDATGRIYRVLERYRNKTDTILLNRVWDASYPGGTPDKVWVVPPPVTGSPPVPHGRYPCIAVYQKAIRF